MATATNPARTIGGVALSLLVSISMAANQAQSLMNGAPSMACATLRPLHGFNLAHPASASQFFVSQSALGYKPGENITVDLMTHSSERHFRGFVVQAYDPSSGSKIGHFVEGSEAKPIDSCSAATHRNSQHKKQVSITWVPPSGGGGSHINSSNSSSSPAAGDHPPTSHHQQQVRFRASIVVSYEEFYTGFESSENKFDKFTYANGHEERGSS